MLTNNYTPLVFHQGNHGNWLLWCLEYFGNPKFKDLPNPFVNTGAAHNHIFSRENNFHQGYIRNYKEWRAFLRAGPKVRLSNIVMMHSPLNTEDYKDFLQCISEDCNKTIVIKYDPANVIDQLNCALERADSVDNGVRVVHGGEFWLNVFNQIISNKQELDKIYNISLPNESDSAVVKNTKMQQIDRWILRELLSLQDIVGLANQAHTPFVPDSNAFVLDVQSLYSNFEETISNCIAYLGQPYSLQNVDKMSIMYSVWISKQPHRGKDMLIKQILDSIDTGTDFSWQQLSVFDESIIQRALTTQGVDLQVFGLNEFPTTTSELKKICK